MDFKGRLSGVSSQDPQKYVLRQGVLCKWITGEVFLKETSKEKGEAKYEGEKC